MWAAVHAPQPPERFALSSFSLRISTPDKGVPHHSAGLVGLPTVRVKMAWTVSPCDAALLLSNEDGARRHPGNATLLLRQHAWKSEFGHTFVADLRRCPRQTLARSLLVTVRSSMDFLDTVSRPPDERLALRTECLSARSSRLRTRKELRHCCRAWVESRRYRSVVGRRNATTACLYDRQNPSCSNSAALFVKLP